jgi:hypothetical protein
METMKINLFVSILFFVILLFFGSKDYLRAEEPIQIEAFSVKMNE